MTRLEQAAGSQRTDQASVLWNKVVEARAVVARQRNLPNAQFGWVARADLVAALEAYVAYLTERGRPIPYTLRDELRIRRLTR